MRVEVLKAFKKSVNKKHGKTLGLAKNIRPLDMPRLSSGSLSFDFSLGGGFPISRVTAINGVKSSGKTTQALRIISFAQKLCANCLRLAKDFRVIESGYDDETGEVEYAAAAHCDCYKTGIFTPKPYIDEYSDSEKGTLKQIEIDIEENGKKKKKKTTLFKERCRRYEDNSYEEFRVVYFDVEGTFDSGWAETIGVDTRLLLVDVPSTAEECIDIYDDLLKQGVVSLLVLDSIAAMAPSIEIESSTEKEQRGAQARLVTKFTRKVVASSNDCLKTFGYAPTHIWINQVRANMDIRTNKFEPWIYPGGNAHKFAASVVIFMEKPGWTREKIDTDLKKDFQINMGFASKIRYRIINNKTATPQASGFYEMIAVGPRLGQIDELKYVLDQAVKYGFFREDGTGNKKKWYVANEEFDKKAAALARIEEKQTFDALKNAVLKRMIDGLNSGEML